MEMNFEKSSGQKKWRNQTFCVIGAPKIGKSELFASGEGTAFLDIEGGLSHLSVVKFPKDRPFLDYDELEGTIDSLVALKQSNKFPQTIDTVVVDTATRLTQLASDKAVEILNRKFPNKGWETIEEISHSNQTWVVVLHDVFKGTCDFVQAKNSNFTFYHLSGWV